MIGIYKVDFRGMLRDAKITGISDKLTYTGKPVIKKLTPKRKALTVSIAKTSTAYGTSRFQIRYKIKGAKKWTTRTVGSSKTQTLKKLKTGKRYTVQVRAKGVYSGPWSTAKTSGRIK